ncbi:MAG TPA: methyltransferase [Candidatus Nanoarchaeia archaeon]|nr:methyltransferase [Candidatus Nanoarchaeia archaeon]
MKTTLPEITQSFIAKIKQDAAKGTYSVDVSGIKIDVFPYIFPPCSPFSESTHTVYDQFGDLNGKEVLDIGTGTGIQAIQASLAGAKQVDACDILSEAVDCAKHNVNINGLSQKINCFQSDLFSNVLLKRYDLIIANLPIVDCAETDLRLHSLIDPSFMYHERLFADSKPYLSDTGKITLCHADLQSKDDFGKLEGLATKNGFDYTIRKEVCSLGHTWRNYEFSLSKKIGAVKDD